MSAPVKVQTTREFLASTPSTQVSIPIQTDPQPSEVTGPSQAELDQLKELVKFLKEEN